MRFKALLLLICTAILLIGCGREQEQTLQPPTATSPAQQKHPVYRFSVHPLHNPSKLLNSYQALVDYLNRNLTGAHIQLEASRDYAQYEIKYQQRKPEFLLPNPWQTLQAMKYGYTVIAMAGDPKDFRGIFIVRTDSGIRVPEDLKGKAVSYPSPTALAACIMPQYYLYQRGIDVNNDIDNRYVGSQESSIMNVYLGLTAAGATWPPPWRAFQKEHPKKAAQLEVIWATEPLVNNSVMARDDVPAELRQRVQQLLVELDDKPEGIEILAGIETARFYPASEADYEVVRAYVDRFERDVREIE